MNKYYSDEELNLKIENETMYEFLRDKVSFYGDKYAYNYFNKKYTFKQLFEYVEKCARSLKTIGINEGDVVTICMPNTPEALINLLAVNKIGAVFDLVHPLSSEVEIKNYVNNNNSKLLIAINICFDKLKNIKDDLKCDNIVIVNASDSMPLFLNVGYNLTEGRKTDKKQKFYIFWKEFLLNGSMYSKETIVHKDSSECACILHSGGTTGKPKSIMLSNHDFIAIASQGRLAFKNLEVGDTILCILPVFHCFGLIVSMYAPLSFGMTCILIPQFDAKRFDKLLSKYHSTVIAGVPTLFEALLKNTHMDNVDLSNVKHVISGGDTLKTDRNKAVNEFLKNHGTNIEVTQGYGMTETSGPITFGSCGSGKLGSCGAPLPGNEVLIVDKDTKEILKTGEIGEIYGYSKALMMGYLDNDKDNEFEIINDKKYIKTGDLGYLDEDGVLFYSGRIKRIIISSGYNVYPNYIEEVFTKNKYIKECCVVGKPHPYKKEVPIIFIVLNDQYELNYTIKKEIMDYAKKQLAHYMIPKEYIFKESLPKTLVGKIDFKKVIEDNKKESN